MADGKPIGFDDFSISIDGKDGNAGNTDTTDKGGNSGGAGNAGGTVDPAEARTADAGVEYTGTLNKDGSPRKKPGRKTGGAKKENNSADINADIEGDVGLILLVHSFLSAATPEMEMGEQEATQIATAWERVARHYPFIQKILSSKVKDHIGFAGVMGKAYGSRIGAIRLRKMAENMKDVTPGPSVATPGPGHPAYQPR